MDGLLIHIRVHLRFYCGRRGHISRSGRWNTMRRIRGRINAGTLALCTWTTSGTCLLNQLRFAFLGHTKTTYLIAFNVALLTNETNQWVKNETNPKSGGNGPTSGSAESAPSRLALRPDCSLQFHHDAGCSASATLIESRSKEKEWRLRNSARPKWSSRQVTSIYAFS